jgi:hypothetical protein
LGDKVWAKECVYRHVMYNYSRAGNGSVGAEANGLGEVLDILSVRSVREDDGAVSVKELANGDNSSTISGGRVNYLNDSFVR